MRRKRGKWLLVGVIVALTTFLTESKNTDSAVKHSEFFRMSPTILIKDGVHHITRVVSLRIGELLRR